MRKEKFTKITLNKRALEENKFSGEFFFSPLYQRGAGVISFRVQIERKRAEKEKKESRNEGHEGFFLDFLQAFTHPEYSSRASNLRVENRAALSATLYHI